MISLMKGVRLAVCQGVPLNVPSLVILVRYWLRCFNRVVNALCRVVRLLSLGLLYIIPVGGMSFVHGRYLYPVTGLILLGSTIRRWRRDASIPVVE